MLIANSSTQLTFNVKDHCFSFEFFVGKLHSHNSCLHRTNNEITAFHSLEMCRWKNQKAIEKKNTLGKTAPKFLFMTYVNFTIHFTRCYVKWLIWTMNNESKRYLAVYFFSFFFRCFLISTACFGCFMGPFSPEIAYSVLRCAWYFS